jgi:phosphatidylserine/phosphatidylglycerophosphate/cardiolipin synthase-like enzyme
MHAESIVRTFLALLPLVAVACSPDNKAPELALEGGLSTEGGIDIWWTDPGTAPGEEQDSELDDALVELIDASTTTLDLALYEFDLELVQDAVLDAWDRGVDVRMVGDGDEVHDAGYVALANAGIPMELRPAGNRIMHHKFAVVDGQAVWTGSTNVSHNGLNRNDNHSIIVRSSDMAAAYSWEFDEMFGGEFGRGKTALGGSRTIDLADGSLEWHFAPTHNPIDVVVDAIDGAEESVAFMVFSFTRADVVDALLRARARGVEVVGIFDESQANGAYSVDEDLALAGVPVFIDGNENASGFSGGKLHHKVLIVDGNTANAGMISGSMNWSNAGTSDNDENLVWIESPSVARPMLESFCALLDRAVPHPDAAADAPQLCDELSDAPARPAADVVINEVMVVESGRSGARQAFVELVMGRDGKADLTGWTLRASSGRVFHTFGAVEASDDAPVVLVNRGSNVRDGVTVTANRPLRLGRVEELELVDATGTVADRFSLEGAEVGVSLNRVFDRDGASAPAHHDRLNRQALASSPGLRMDGSSFRMTAPEAYLSINELLPNPVGTDAGQEFVELVNAGDTPLDLEGYTLCDESGVCHTFEAATLLPDQVVVLFDEGDHSDVEGAVLSESGRLSLNNSGDTLTLTDVRGTVHDVASWSSSAEGVSWNRTDDGGLDSGWSLHDEVNGATASLSPGLRVDGSSWAAPL